MPKTKVYKHHNGYYAILYGKSSMMVINPEGKRILHTGNRNVNTENEVDKLLEEMPNFIEKLTEIH